MLVYPQSKGVPPVPEDAGLFLQTESNCDKSTPLVVPLDPSIRMTLLQSAQKSSNTAEHSPEHTVGVPDAQFVGSLQHAVMTFWICSGSVDVSHICWAFTTMIHAPATRQRSIAGAILELG
jgi:hypothetical protein